MLSFGARRIFLATEPADLRKSFDTLSALVKARLACDPYTGDAFVFIGKRKNRLKALLWEESGFWLCAKRLEQGTFALPKGSADGKIRLGPSDWQLLLEGIIVLKAKKLKRYKIN